MNATIEMRFRLPYRLGHEAGAVVSICDVLDVRSQGDTDAEAEAMLAEALQRFLETCIEEGTAGAVLRESGFEQMPA